MSLRHLVRPKGGLSRRTSSRLGGLRHSMRRRRAKPILGRARTEPWGSRRRRTTSSSMRARHRRGLAGGREGTRGAASSTRPRTSSTSAGRTAVAGGAAVRAGRGRVQGERDAVLAAAAARRGEAPGRVEGPVEEDGNRRPSRPTRGSLCAHSSLSRLCLPCERCPCPLQRRASVRPAVLS